MSFKLPPLNGLRFFEAAARHCSFRAAAEELCITPSAVSHGIRTLEEWMSVKLFDRDPSGLRITESGEMCLKSVKIAFDLLSEATDQVTGRRATGTLVLSVAPTFASRWLLPRLARFTAIHPNIVISVDTARQRVAFPQDGFDLAIRLSRRSKSDGMWASLIQESLFPVCAPSLLTEFDTLSIDELLTRVPLISVSSVGDEWADWFAATRIAPVQNKLGLRVDTVELALEAASGGLGIALGRTPLVDDDLENGRLIPLTNRRLAGTSRYWLVSAPANFQRPEIKAFRRWIMDELATGQPTVSARTVACERRSREAANRTIASR
jgi:LysR family glycine cleavage system transcriptional activator